MKKLVPLAALLVATSVSAGILIQLMLSCLQLLTIGPLNMLLMEQTLKLRKLSQ